MVLDPQNSKDGCRPYQGLTVSPHSGTESFNTTSPLISFGSPHSSVLSAARLSNGTESYSWNLALEQATSTFEMIAASARTPECLPWAESVLHKEVAKLERVAWLDRITFALDERLTGLGIGYLPFQKVWYGIQVINEAKRAIDSTLLRDRAIAQPSLVDRLRLAQLGMKIRAEYEGLSPEEAIDTLVIGLARGFRLCPDDRAWLKDKLEEALRVIPAAICSGGGFAKVIRTLIGVGYFGLEAIPAEASIAERRSLIGRAIKAGFCYGMLYPLVDDVMDSSAFLTANEKRQLYHSISQALSGHRFASFSDSFGIANSLCAVFDDLQALLPPPEFYNCWKALEITFRAQVEDSEHTIGTDRSAEQIFPILILKAGFSRIAAAELAGLSLSSDVVENMLLMGFVNQARDDMRDFADDRKNGVFTPFTHCAQLIADGRSPDIDPLSLVFGAMRLVENRMGPQAARLLMGKFVRALCAAVDGSSDSAELFVASDPALSDGIKKLLVRLQALASSSLDLERNVASNFNEALFGKQFR